MKRTLQFDQLDGSRPYRWPDGQQTTMIMMSRFFGDGCNENDLPEKLSRIVNNEPPWLSLMYGSLFCIGRTDPEEFFQEIVTGEPPFPAALLHYLDHPGLREPLAHVVRHRRAKRDPWGYTQVLGLVGGPAARDVLRERLANHLTDPRTRSDQEEGRELEAAAEALLRLDPDSTDAARALIGLFEHVDRDVRFEAVHGAVSVLGQMKTEAMRLLEAALFDLLDAEDTRLFPAAAPRIACDKGNLARSRCEMLLRGEQVESRQWAAVALLKMPGSQAGESLRALARWLPDGEPMGLALWVASILEPILPEDIVESVIRRGFARESPTHRVWAFELSQKSAKAGRQALVKEALVDEPDPWLRDRMSKSLRQS